MGFRTGAYATVWSVESESPSVAKVRLSTQRKNKKTEEWEQDFSGFCRFIDSVDFETNEKITTAKDALKLSARDRIKIGDCEVTTRYDKEARKEYVNYTVFSFELVDGKKSSPQKPVDDPIEGDTDNFPF